LLKGHLPGGVRELTRRTSGSYDTRIREFLEGYAIS